VAIPAENRIAIPKTPFQISLSGDWSAISDIDGLEQISGSGADTDLNENFNRLFRVINDQNKIIKDLLNQMRVAGYDIS